MSNPNPNPNPKHREVAEEHVGAVVVRELKPSKLLYRELTHAHLLLNQLAHRPRGDPQLRQEGTVAHGDGLGACMCACMCECMCACVRACLQARMPYIYACHISMQVRRMCVSWSAWGLDPYGALHLLLLPFTKDLHRMLGPGLVLRPASTLCNHTEQMQQAALVNASRAVDSGGAQPCRLETHLPSGVEGVRGWRG